MHPRRETQTLVSHVNLSQECPKCRCKKYTKCLQHIIHYMEQYGNMAMFTSYLAPGHSRGGPTGASAIEQWAHITGALFEQLYVPASTWGKWDFSLFVLALQTNQKYKKSDFNGILMWFTEKSESNTFKSGFRELHRLRQGIYWGEMVGSPAPWVCSSLNSRGDI